MLAEKYGYWVSGTPAVEVSRTAESALALNLVRDSRTSPRSLTAYGVSGAILLVVGIVFAAAVNNVAAFIFFLYMAMIPWVAYLFHRVRIARSPPSPRRVGAPLAQQPWQAWPCRVEGVKGNPDSLAKLIHLISPDQEVVQTFRSRMPRSVWLAMTDGMGVLWVCGDLRYPVVFGTVNGTNLWTGVPVRKLTQSPVATAIFTDVISGASVESIKTLLQP